jgi:hypothetical protein
LAQWTDAVQVTTDGSQEAPFVFRWKGGWWMIVDAIRQRGLRIYKSEDGIGGWRYVSTILGPDDEGTRSDDKGQGHHPGIVIQRGADGQEQCLVFYFTHRGRRSVIQLAELELAPDGTIKCDRNKHAAGGTAASRSQ